VSADDVLNPRRAPRVPARLRVEVRHRFAAWHAETEDVGPRGCQLVTPRLVEPGRTVKLAIECPALGRTVRTSGKVVWWRPEPPSRLGIAFDEASTDRAWFAELVAADPRSAGALRRVADKLPGRMRLHLGTPPQTIVDFSADEVAVLRRIGTGVTVDALVRSFGKTAERPLGALFALLARRLLVLDARAAAPPEAWQDVLSSAAPDPSSRPPEAQRLYDEGLAHLGAGRVQLAARRFADALALAPADRVLREHVQRLARWA
jgi:hypothetical protein